MKSKIIAVFLFVIVAGFKSDSTLNSIIASDIVGTYWNETKDIKVRIFLAVNGKYSGKVEWMKYPNNADGTPKIDFNNPNKSIRHKQRVGLVILRYFKFDKQYSRWTGGSVYDPKKGKTYNGYIEFEGSNKNIVNLRGYVMGMPFLGRTAVWSRVNQ
jgi:uncharacterized protein (DUF2147 family)